VSAHAGRRADLAVSFRVSKRTKIYDNLKAAMEVVNGQAPDAPEAVHAAWQSLFLLVPVVSTTFASLGRMFAPLGAGTLGWLLIDEAGQAVPQAAVGGLWRSKRAVIVGDPLQVEPVVVVPFTAQRRLRAHLDVPERWLPSRASVQTLADEINPFGTSLLGDPDPLWVGAPLRVHRRCIDPMFSIANEIAYDGLMISAAVERPGPPLPASCWYDVRGPSEGHWRPEQGEAATELLRDLEFEHGLAPSDVFVISPFRSVANRMREEIGRPARVGTIHTAQGRQASVVILVLGGDTAKPRAKTFATDKPNVLNVAVTRAQRRVYIVGDYADWAALPHFDVAARCLERRAWPIGFVGPSAR
jgi:superfamily I DNA and/or RNA helicase